MEGYVAKPVGSRLGNECKVHCASLMNGLAGGTWLRGLIPLLVEAVLAISAGVADVVIKGSCASASDVFEISVAIERHMVRRTTGSGA